MDSDSEDDMLYYSHQKLSSLIHKKGDKNAAIKDYLENLNYQPIKDFSQGLEWFNVSEPLSFSKHLKGKIVVLDFFTYCCINCMHIIPDLREIEKQFSVEDGLVVIGVHSAKFENEKISSNILAAVQRYNITHPVVNDHNSQMWKNCEVQCWPTLLILGPNSNPIVMLMGEGHKENLQTYIKVSLEYYKSKKQISDHRLPFKSAYHLLPDLKGPLLFPGKITKFIDEKHQEILAISDTGNNRILIFKPDGTILHQVGSGKVGFWDDTLESSEFNAPQGLVFKDKNILFVADTENHAIRKIDLKENKVETVVGMGVQGHDRVGGKLWKQQEISSPWDLCIYRTPDMDMTFYPDGNPPLREVLIIAMAGTHQIWALFLEDTVWWKCKKYSAGTCLSIAGSGREENRNNLYPNSAGFAQPSGLALCSKNKEVYIADSESSSVRRLSLVDGKVTPVVGGDRNPNNLFAFGDKDGSLCEAKLQHLLGLAMSKDEETLFVADTYNHKLKKVNIAQNLVTTLSAPTSDTTDGKISLFSEPAGLCVSFDGKKIYLADTNNHSIKILKLGSDYNIKAITKLELNVVDNVSKNNEIKHQIIESKPVTVNGKGGKLIFDFEIIFANGLKLTEEAMQRWSVKLPDVTWSCVPNSGDNVKNIDVVVSVPDGKDGKINFIFDLVTCTVETCLPKSFIIRVPVTFKKNGATSITTRVKAILDPNNIEVH
ncbi:NHL repeat-containing protein 2 [Asbolus verrucosus]|uniref:NHL repeat-containing protein 2 n=1 Tax=Asbolus verrucosus TaxID=1661398 RepID=A0A482VJS2_ASBVE|nr:NHL repeat-containing protein 2 [Asbolus verrucosus]